MNPPKRQSRQESTLQKPECLLSSMLISVLSGPHSLRFLNGKSRRVVLFRGRQGIVSHGRWYQIPADGGMRLKQEYALTDTRCVSVLRESVVGTCADIQSHKANFSFTVVNRVADDLLREERSDECNDKKDGGSLHYSPLRPSWRLSKQVFKVFLQV
jgi:hypothetical protein